MICICSYIYYRDDKYIFIINRYENSMIFFGDKILGIIDIIGINIFRIERNG